MDIQGMRMQRKSFVKRLGLVGVAAVLPGLAQAQVGPLDLEQRFWLQLSAFSADIASTAQVTSRFGNQVGSRLELENDYGLPKRKLVPALAAGLRIGQRWRMELETLATTRSGREVQLTREITLLETTYPINASVRASFDLQSTRFGAGYSAYQSETAEFGLAFGLLASSYKVQVDLLSVNSGRLSASASKTQTAFLPMLGVYGRFNLSPEWSLAGQVETGRDPFGGGGSDGNSRGNNVSLNAAWRITPQAALHIGYRRLNATIDQRDGFVIALSRTQSEYTLSGPQVGLSLSF
jgi:hypothetical protein